MCSCAVAACTALRDALPFGPTSTQINKMVRQVVPSDPANWPQYGSVDIMTEFVVDRSNLVGLSEKAFSVVNGASAAARLSPEECVQRAKCQHARAATTHGNIAARQ